MITYQLTHTDPQTQAITRVTDYIGGNPPIRRHGNLPQINDGLPDGYTYVPITPQSDYPHDTATQKLVRMTQTTATEDGWDVVDLTAEELASRQPSPAMQLASARSAMSGLIANLPVESRAKFAEPRAGIETLLDLGDIEAAHFKLTQIVTDTPDEDYVKTTLVNALGQFLTP